MIRLALIGFGTVGQGFVEVLYSKHKLLQQNYQLDCQVVAIADPRYGSILDTQGINLDQLLAGFKTSGTVASYPAETKGLDSFAIITQAPADIIVELTPTSLDTAQPALDHIRTALSGGKHVVTSNKGPLVLAYENLKKVARQNQVQFRFESTVMSGTPVLNVSTSYLAGCHISGIRGILNGTSNFILSQMEQGETYATALATAQKAGYAEADPAGDVEGWDALAKVIILANVLLNASLKVADVAREGITHLTPSDIQTALKAGFRWKLIGEVQKNQHQITASVRPQKVPLSHPLANIQGTTNAVTLDTDLLGPVTIVGAGAGKHETAFGILNDILQIALTGEMGRQRSD